MGFVAIDFIFVCGEGSVPFTSASVSGSGVGISEEGNGGDDCGESTKVCVC